MVMTFDQFVNSQFGLAVGLIVLGMGLVALLRGVDKPRAEKTMTSMITYMAMIVLGGYIAALHLDLL